MVTLIGPLSFIGEKNKKVMFRFDTYARSIAALIADENGETPMVVGIYGPWGSGKTTLMEQVADQLDKMKPKKGNGLRACKPVWFQAWKYAGEDAILAALIEEIFIKISSDKGLVKKFQVYFNDIKKRFEKVSESLKINLKVPVMGSSLSAELGALFRNQERQDKIGFIRTFEEEFSNVLKVFKNNKETLVIFIEDLDRCPHDRVLKILETIKLFMDKEGCVFVIGADKKKIEGAVETNSEYEPTDAKLFLDKIVQVTFTLPEKSVEDITEYLESLVPEGDPIHARSRDIAEYSKCNPRTIKRFLNDLSLRKKLVVEINPDLDKQDLEIAYDGFALLARGDWKIIVTTLENIKDLMKDEDLNKSWSFKEKDIDKVNDQRVLDFVRDRKFVNLLCAFLSEGNEGQNVIEENTEKVIQAVVRLSEVAGEIKKAPAEASQMSSLRYEGGDYDPDAMVEVPAGPFLYGDGKKEKVIDDAYRIDMYPVTNERYRRFVNAGGYGKKEFWSGDGWEWKEEEKITQPKYWGDPDWNQPDHPVVGVSWYEAEAFAKWEGKRLPTEREWEKAARGEDGREYPWGNEFDSEKCNSPKSQIGKTTPVTRYVNGLSLYGCYDMAGNVWEWQSDWYNMDVESIVLRGGSWYNDISYIHSAFRGYGHPIRRDNHIGFRCAQ